MLLMKSFRGVKSGQKVFSLFPSPSSTDGGPGCVAVNGGGDRGLGALRGIDQPERRLQGLDPGTHIRPTVRGPEPSDAGLLIQHHEFLRGAEVVLDQSPGGPEADDAAADDHYRRVLGPNRELLCHRRKGDHDEG